MGGGNSSALGTTTLPVYMREIHADWLGNAGEMGVPDHPITDTGGSDLTTTMRTLIIADSPYASYSYTDPTARISSMESAVSLLLAEKDSLSEIQTNWDTVFNKAMTEVANELDVDIATIQTLTATEWEDLDDQAREQLATLLNDTHIHTVLAFFETWSNIYTAVKTKADADIADRSSDTVDNSAAVLAEIDDHNTVYTAILTKINALIAVDNYEVSDADIATLKSAFEGTIKPDYEKTLSEFFGGMAALNAINSSAFMIGGAMIMRGKDRELANFEANLIKGNIDNKIKFYQDRLKYVDLYSRVYASINIGAATQLNIAKGSYEAAKAGLMISYETLYSGFIQDLSKTYAIIDAGKAQVGATLQTSYEDRRVEYVTQALRGMVFMLVSQAQLRWQLVGQGTGTMMSQYMTNKDIMSKYATMSLEQNRMAQVMDTEYEERELFLDVKDDLWDLTIFKYGGDVLSAIGSSGASYIPDGPSPVGQGLGGALSGAAMGAQLGSAVPGIGTAIGAGVGALLGGIGGYLQ